jgi:hypothetical protein
MPLKGWENTKGFSSSEPLQPSKSRTGYRYPPSKQPRTERRYKPIQTMPSSISNTSSCGEQDTKRTLAISKTHRTKHRQNRFTTLIHLLLGNMILRTTLLSALLFAGTTIDGTLISVYCYAIGFRMNLLVASLQRFPQLHDLDVV